MNYRAIACFVVGLIASGSALAQDTHVALVKNVTGVVTVMRNGTAIAAAAGTQLEKSDALISEVGASSGVVFKDGTLLTIGGGTEIHIRDYVFEPKDAKYAFSVYMNKGSAVYSSGKIGKLSPESVSIETPKAVIGVRGTRFLITATE